MKRGRLMIGSVEVNNTRRTRILYMCIVDIYIYCSYIIIYIFPMEIFHYNGVLENLMCFSSVSILIIYDKHIHWNVH